VSAPIFGLIRESFPAVVKQLYFSKAWDWQTETEYRLVIHGDDVQEVEYVDIRHALTGIFLGSQFPEERRDDVLARCPHLVENRIFMVLWRNGSPW
jgi:hypothetical protein